MKRQESVHPTKISLHLSQTSVEPPDPRLLAACSSLSYREVKGGLLVSISSGRRLDVLFVEADSSTLSYQDLSKTYSAIETPTWSLLLAESCRSKGYGVAIMDCVAEHLGPEQAAGRVSDADPRLILFVVYGQNPNSGTTNMEGALRTARAIKQAHPQTPIAFVGSHTSALPKEVLAFDCVDIVLIGEGVYALHSLLASNLQSDLPSIKGIGHKSEGIPTLNAPERLVPQERMDIDLPGYAWDLLPYKSKPLDLYRAHFWHAEFDHAKRTPFATIYTSLGCKFGCSFCMINIVNRTDYSEGVTSGNSRVMRWWSAGNIMKTLNQLKKLGVDTLRIADEMFFLDKRHFDPIVNTMVEQDLRFRMWAYSRVDTVKREYLETFLKVGINWLALGIEAGSQEVRKEVSKGSFKDVNIREVVADVRATGMNVISNYIFGLPNDTHESMQRTLDLALELCTEMANMYPAQALPGSTLYMTAKQNGWPLPETFSGYGFLSYDSQPLPTNHLKPAEVIKFRDEAWQKYFTYPPYLDLVEKKFGPQERRNVEDMAKIKLKRRLLEN